MEIPCEKYDLQELGIESAHYYYHTYPGIDNCFTVCVLIDKNDGMVARGVAICSLADCHNKKVARRNSLGRAVRAIKRKDCSSPIDTSRGSRNGDWIWLKCDVTNKESEFITSIKDASLTNSLRVCEIKKDGKSDRVVLEFAYPFIFPVQVAEKFFDWKSDYYPVPTEYEIDVLRVKEMSGSTQEV